MTTLHARRAWLPSGWTADTRIGLAAGRIATVTPGVVAEPDDIRVDLLLPGIANLHSHAFQRAIAGRTEHRIAGQDSFWTWREAMYGFLARLDPDQVEAIAALVFMEMQEAGFPAVAEFHYLHHQPDGRPHDDPAEMSARICAAAAETGIGLTLLPVLYTHGGAGGQPAGPGQRRFVATPEGFGAILDGAARAVAALPGDALLGMAPHSLRAVTPATLAEGLAMRPAGPVHIHAAEQPREVAEVTAALGARPVQWLLDHAAIDDDWCVIHATHMLPEETRALARSGAVAGLCPITEADLGDGPFDGARFVAAGGRFGVGSDSNLRLSVLEELRMLEFSQRLHDLARNVLTPGSGSTGGFLWHAAARGGARALGRDAGEIAPGRLADLVALDGSDPVIAALPPAQLLDGLVFAGRDGTVTDLWSAGRHMVQAGRHVAREAIVARARTALARLSA